MANEFQINSSLQITNGANQYISRPTAFIDNQSRVGGPSPGSFPVSVSGTDISFSNLTQPGWTFFQNLDATNIVRIGPYDTGTGRWYPFLTLPPTLGCVVKLADLIDQEITGTGSATSGIVVTIRAKAENATCDIKVDSFET
jgi:hypothetical protein